MITYMPMRAGQVLHHEVCLGLILNNCLPAPCAAYYKIGNRNEVRENIQTNWNAAFMAFIDSSSEVFMGMDSDIVLEDGVLDRMYQNLGENDIVTYPVVQNKKCQHGIFLAKRMVIGLNHRMYSPITKCPVCEWMNKFSTMSVKIFHMNDVPMREIERFDFERSHT